MNARLMARCTGPRPFDGACGFLRRFGWCGHFVMACDCHFVMACRLSSAKLATHREDAPQRVSGHVDHLPRSSIKARCFNLCLDEDGHTLTLRYGKAFSPSAAAPKSTRRRASRVPYAT